MSVVHLIICWDRGRPARIRSPGTAGVPPASVPLGPRASRPHPFHWDRGRPARIRSAGTAGVPPASVPLGPWASRPHPFRWDRGRPVRIRSAGTAGVPPPSVPLGPRASRPHPFRWDRGRPARIRSAFHKRTSLKNLTAGGTPAVPVLGSDRPSKTRLIDDHLDERHFCLPVAKRNPTFLSVDQRAACDEDAG